MRKRKQHHVWSYYLRPWAPDGSIWCLRHDRIFHTSLEGVANRRDFYLLEPLSEEELLLARQLALAPTPQQVQAANMGWLETLQLPFSMKRMLVETASGHPGDVEAFEEWAHNFGENLHSKVEDSFKVHLNSLRNGDTSFYLDDEDSADFLHSLCIQCTRTVGFRNAIMNAIRAVKGADARPLAKVLAYLFANNMAWVLYAERRQRRLVFVLNMAEIPFITGDQPVVNTLASDSEPGQEPSELELYYPLGPDLAILITQPGDQRGGEISASQSMVEKFNRCISQSSHEQLYADRRSILEEGSYLK